MLTLGVNTQSNLSLSRRPQSPGRMVSLANTTCSELLVSLRSILDRGNEIFNWMDSERDLARRLGIETIVIELMALVEGVRLRYIHDALQDAVEANSGCDLTEEGIATLHRAENLIAEAEKRLPKGSNGTLTLSGNARNLSQDSNPSNTWLIVSVIFMGTVALAAIGLAFYLARKK